MQEDAVWNALARALKGEYDIVARLGLGSGGAPVYLARELMTDTLVALRLPPLESGGDSREFGLEVVRQIDSSLPAIETRCSHCSAILRQWSRFCTSCGRDISGLAPSPGGQTRETLRRLARDTASGKYDVLGEMSRVEGGGMVYFGRERATGQVVGLQLEAGPESSLVITATHFAPHDPTIQLSESRRAPGDETGRRVSVPKDPRAGSTMSASTAESMALARQRMRAVIMTIAVVVTAIAVYTLVRLI
jgi:hypothetical protein